MTAFLYDLSGNPLSLNGLEGERSRDFVATGPGRGMAGAEGEMHIPCHYIIGDR